MLRDFYCANCNLFYDDEIVKQNEVFHCTVCLSELPRVPQEFAPIGVLHSKVPLRTPSLTRQPMTNSALRKIEAEHEVQTPDHPARRQQLQMAESIQETTARDLGHRSFAAYQAHLRVKNASKLSKKA